MSVSQYDLTRFLEDQDTEEGQEINDYGESSTGGKLLYFLFGLIWMCLICQLAGMLKARERREREYAAQAAERVEMDQIQKNEQWRAKLQSLFVQREVVRVSRNKGNMSYCMVLSISVRWDPSISQSIKSNQIKSSTRRKKFLTWLCRFMNFVWRVCRKSRLRI
jgi:hypothetical protein